MRSCVCGSCQTEQLSDMKKIIVIGCPGSGKSTFARALHKITGIPLCHLDMLFWNEDKTTVGRDAFLERVASVIAGDEWIIDGNYGSTMEGRIAACDTVFFLDYPLEVCLDGVRSRIGKPRADMPWVETAEDEQFIEFIRGYGEKERPEVLRLLGKYCDKRIIVFTSREQADAFLEAKTLVL